MLCVCECGVYVWGMYVGCVCYECRVCVCVLCVWCVFVCVCVCVFVMSVLGVCVSEPNPETSHCPSLLLLLPELGTLRCRHCLSTGSCVSASELVCPAGSTHCYSGVLSLRGGKPGHGDPGGLNMMSLKECGASLPELG